MTADPDGDRIAEVNPATGTIIRVIGATGATGLYGLGYWGGIAYGFSSSGLLVKIDLTSGAGTPVPISGAPAAGFYGAGTTTVAPIYVDCPAAPLPLTPLRGARGSSHIAPRIVFSSPISDSTRDETQGAKARARSLSLTCASSSASVESASSGRPRENASRIWLVALRPVW